MRGPIRFFAVPAVLLLSCCLQAQIAPPMEPIRSLEIRVKEADRIVVAKVASVSPERERKVSVAFAVKKTVKGPHRTANTFEVPSARGAELEGLRALGHELLVFVVPLGNDSTLEWLDLTRPRQAIVTADLRILLDRDEILAAARRAVEKPPPRNGPAVAIPLQRLLGSATGYWDGNLLVPADRELERNARAALDSRFPWFREWGVEALRPFRTEENALLLKKLAERDDGYVVEKSDRENRGLEVRRFPVREAALRLLKEWNFPADLAGAVERVSIVRQPDNAVPGPFDSNPILLAAAQNDLAKVRSLLEADPKLLHAADSDRRTALHYAAAHGSANVLKELLRRGADPNAKTTQDVTPLQWAVEFSTPEVAKLLLEGGADPNLTRKATRDLIVTGQVFADATYSPLGYSLTFGKDGHSLVLLEAGAELNRLDEAGWSPLMYAIRSRRPGSLLRTLLAKGADPNLRRPNANGPLHIAALNGDEPAMRLLLAAGADPFARNKDGKTAFELLEKR
jgi:ankyrin repeat protein